MVNELNDATFAKNVNKGSVVADFYADWCGPCQLMKPLFEKMSHEFNSITFFRVNVDKAEHAAAAHDIRSIPTLVFLKHGKEVDRIIGLPSEGDFKKKIKEVFK